MLAPLARTRWPGTSRNPCRVSAPSALQRVGPSALTPWPSSMGAHPDGGGGGEVVVVRVSARPIGWRPGDGASTRLGKALWEAPTNRAYPCLPAGLVVVGRPLLGTESLS